MFTVLAALSGTEHEYIRDRTLKGHESARGRSKAIGSASVTDDVLSQEMPGEPEPVGELLRKAHRKVRELPQIAREMAAVARITSYEGAEDQPKVDEPA